MTPGLSHVLIALAIHAAVSFVALVLGAGGHQWVGFAAAAWFYIGRERRQSEEYFGSNRIAPWRWKPRALRDLAWPVLAAGIAALAVPFAPVWLP